MATSSLSAIASSISSVESSVWKYDLFMSFRGEDTRKGIVSHLYHELQKTGGIRTFKDDDGGLEVGAPISPGLLKAIEQSRFGIVILSSNYATSTWCLDELVHIFRCMEGQDRILPLFYEVNPSDVRKQGGSFQLLFSKHKENSYDQNKLEEWRVALSKVANLSGWHSNNFRSDRELVEDIVESIFGRVNNVPRFIAIDDKCFKGDIKNDLFSVGPYGSISGGNSFDDGVYTTVKQLVLHCSSIAIQCIQIEYDWYGTSRWSCMHGNPEGHHEKTTVRLNYPEEYLTSIQGFYSRWSFLPTEIVSLTFKSNKRTYGPFRGENDRISNAHFSIEVPGSKIVGFHGRSNNTMGMLRAIGVHLISEHRLSKRSNGKQVKQIVELACPVNYISGTIATDEDFTDIKNEPISVGPYGSKTGGKMFNDGVYTTVRQLVLYYSSRAIECIQVQYDFNGTSLWSEHHGDSNIEYFKKVTVELDYPEEYLISVQGFYDCLRFFPTEIVSLAFKSNKRTYGPFGGEYDGNLSEHFSIEAPGRKIVGFHGRSNNTMGMLRALGAHFT